jgi:hypothetical protein
LWLSKLGYDEHFFNKESRAFNLTFHSTSKFSVTVKDALGTALDSWVNSAIALNELETEGDKRDF